MKYNFINLQHREAITGALIAAGSTLAAAGGQAYATGRMNKKNRQWQEGRYDQQRIHALEDWDRANKYNSPAQQMQRLREAGLNPHLIYGSGNATSNAAPVRSSDTPSMDQHVPNVGAMLTDPVNAYIETRRFSAQQKLLDAQTLKTLTEVDTKEFDLSQKERLADTQAALIRSILTGKQIDNTINLDKNAREETKLSSDLAEATQRIAKSISDIKLQGMMLEKGNQEIKSIQQMRQKVTSEIDNLNKEGKIKDFEIKLNKLGFTKGDPVYARLATTIIESIGLTPDKIKAKVAEAVKGVEKAAAVQDVLLRTLIPGY